MGTCQHNPRQDRAQFTHYHEVQSELYCVFSIVSADLESIKGDRAVIANKSMAEHARAQSGAE